MSQVVTSIVGQKDGNRWALMLRERRLGVVLES